MASGSDGRLALAKEVTYGTRVAPSRFFPVTSEDLGFTYQRYFSPAIGTGMWSRPSIVTTAVGSGSLAGDVPTTGFGFFLDALHGNVVTPVQQAATTAYLQTHTLDTPPSKSYSVQVQVPPVLTNVLVPHDLLGVMLSGVTFSWSPGGVLAYEFPTIVRELDITQTNVAYVAPTAYNLLAFSGGTVLIGGAAEANVLGSGSFTVGYELRDDAFALGSSGRIAKPVLTDKPRGAGTFTADFNDNTNLLRTINNTQADIVLRFEGAVIATTYKFMLELTLPDCVFTTGRPTIDGPGPVQQTVAFETASSTGDAPVIKYQSTDVAL
jgi:hypothetical protein